MKLMQTKDGLKYSVVVVSYNTIVELAKCVSSLFCYTQNFELILVDNASVDGSVGYIKGLLETHPNVKAIFNTENKNFGPGQNQGFEIAEGKYIISLNSDCYVSLGWTDKMVECMESDPKIAIVGPVSNMSNGRQMIAGHLPGMKTDQIAAQVAAEHAGHWEEAGILYGWCLFMNREFLKDEPFMFDEQFSNSFEDNDVCMRARLRGWKLMIDCSTFMWHEGQASFKKNLNKDFMAKYIENGNKNQKLFYDKWRDDGPKKLIAVYRIANCQDYIAKSLEQTSKFADEIICLFARSQDKTKEIALSFPKVVMHEEWFEEDHPFDEQAERNWLLQAAMARGADWVISIDGDEIYEDKFVENVRGYMNPANPQTMAYWCNWRTIWHRQDDGQESFRMDGIFGGFQNYRFFRVLPGMEIKENSNLRNHHCGSAPKVPMENLKWLNIRVRHLGYDSEEQRQRKYAFYRKADPRPVASDVGNEDYHHLIDKDVKLRAYREKNRLSVFMVIKDEGKNIFEAMSCVEPIADEYVIIDTGCTDNTLEEIERFKWATRKEVRVIQKTFESMEDGYIMNFSEAMNFAKSQCRGEWVLRLDADEIFAWNQVTNIFAFIEDDVDGYLFQVINYLEEPRGPKLEDNVFALSETIRLYRNIDELFYSGLLHESLEDATGVRARNGRGRMLLSPIPIHHRGYLKPKDNMRKKIDRYHIINQRQFLISGGADPRPLFNMALHLINDGDIPGGMALYKKSLEIDPNFWRSSQNIGYHHINMAKKYLSMAASQMPQMMLKNSKVEEMLQAMNKYNFEQPKVA